MRLPFGNGNWRKVKLASHFINLISLMGSDIPRPLRNFRNEELKNTTEQYLTCSEKFRDKDVF